MRGLRIERAKTRDTVQAVNKNRPVWQTFLSVACVVFSLLLPGSGNAACTINSLELPVTMVNGLAITTVRINDTEVPLAVDSGAFYSMLTSAAAEQLHLPVTYAPTGLKIDGLTGKIDARMTRVKKLQLPKGEIPNAEFVVGGNQIGGGAMGLLGRNILTLGDTEYDLAHGVIRLMFPKGECSGANMAYWAGEKPVSELELVRDERELLPELMAIGRLNGNDVNVQFDSGAASSMVTLDTARRVGLSESDMKETGKVYGAGRGEAKAWSALFQKFELADESISKFHLEVADIDSTRSDSDMLLGIDFFLSHRIYVSKVERRMFFTYNGGTVFVNNAAGKKASALSAAAPLDTAQPADADGYARRGAAFAARMDYVHALADLDRACEMAPQKATYFVRRADVHEAMKQLSLALQDFDTALRLDPTLPEARLRRAWMRADSKDRDGAIDDLQTLDKTLAAQADQRLEMATLYARLTLREQALPQLNLWIAAHPQEVNLGDVLSTRCWTRMLLNVELDKALDDCNIALDRRPKDPESVEARAWLQLRRGELDKSLAEFDRALNIQPDLPWSLYGRGIVRRKDGQAEQGNADIEAARKLLPSIDDTAGRYGLGADSKPLSQQNVLPSENDPGSSSKAEKPDGGRL